MLHSAHWKYRRHKITICATLSGYIFEIKALINNRKKLVLLASLGHPSTFQRVSHLGSVTAQHSSNGRQPNFAALNRGRHLYSVWRPSRWALAHICSSCYTFMIRVCARTRTHPGIYSSHSVPDGRAGRGSARDDSGQLCIYYYTTWQYSVHIHIITVIRKIYAYIAACTL